MNRSLAYALLHRCTAAVAGIVALALSAMLMAGPATASEIANRTKLFLDRQALPSGGEVEITVGDPDPRLHLAACQRYEPFIPNGARLWGRTYLGVRCVEGATWSAFMPVHIKVFAASPVAARPIARGQTVSADDVQIERVELTQWPAGVVATADQIEGRVATRAIAAGEPFRRDTLKAQTVVQPGDPVKVVFDGGSFAVSTEGKALTLAADGQAVQVALTAGRVLSGIARAGKVVEIK